MKEKNNTFNVSSASIAGIKKINEDACWVGNNSRKQCLGIVCDGIGSQEGSQNVSRFMVDYFQQAFNKARKIHFIESWFDKTLKSAWLALNQKYLSVKTAMGTTLVLALVSKNNVYCFHIGDSRLYHYDMEKEIWTKKTNDHNLYNLLEKKHATEAVYVKNKDKLLSLTNYIDSQTDKFMEYDFVKFQIQPGDNSLLCSDGLYNYLKINKISSMITLCQQEDFSGLTTKLVQEALLNGSNDNISSVLIEIN